LWKERRLDIRSTYKAYLKDRINFERELCIVIDAGNGTCGFVGDMLKRMGCKVDVLFADPDGRFPNHIPNPLSARLAFISKILYLYELEDYLHVFSGNLLSRTSLTHIPTPKVLTSVPLLATVFHRT
jgi:phosphomannomutase